MSTTQQTEATVLNGINPNDVHDLIATIQADKTQAMTTWGVTTRWTGGCTTETRATEYTIGHRRVAKDFTVRTDEPIDLGGTNTQANPQETLMAAFNACMMVGYTALCTLNGIRLDYLEIDCEGEIDLRGFLGLGKGVKPGYDHLRYTVRIKGDGTPEQFEQIHQMVMKTSPNRFNIAEAIRLEPQLVVER